MARRRKQYDPYKEFRALPKWEQREKILDISSMCIDGAPPSLARRIEIYFDVNEAEQTERATELWRSR